MVYLSRIELELDLAAVWVSVIIPERSSSVDWLLGFDEPPQRTQNASKPRTLIARLLVLANTDAMGGNIESLTVV